LKEFVDVYLTKYGEYPPVNVWSIDLYPLDWINQPNNDPSKLLFYQAKDQWLPHSTVATHQIVGLREYLDSIPQYEDTPIWVTEAAIHLGFQGWTYVHLSTGKECTTQEISNGECKTSPTGDYRWDLMSDYLNKVLDFFDANADALNIERWFFFTAWKDIWDPPASDPYMGIIFFDGPNDGANVNCLGQVYKARAMGLPPISCDSNGNVIP